MNGSSVLCKNQDGELCDIANVESISEGCCDISVAIS